MTHSNNTQSELEQILSGLSSNSFDAAINNPDDYMLLLNRAEQEAIAAIEKLMVRDVNNAYDQCYSAVKVAAKIVLDSRIRNEFLDYYEAYMPEQLEETNPHEK